MSRKRGEDEAATADLSTLRPRDRHGPEDGLPPVFGVKAYAGIGSRETPADVLELMKALGHHLAYAGWTLRSGCAPGADSAFEQGAFDATMMRRGLPRPELFLPWPRFEGRRSVLTARDEPQAQAFKIAARYHPTWEWLSEPVRKLMARNVHQILGPDVTAPTLSRFVLCWTPRGEGGGGTGQAIRIAKDYGVRVFDLAREGDRDRVVDWLTR